MFIGVEQNCVRGLAQVALFFLYLCPEERGIAKVPIRTQGVKPHVCFATVPVGGAVKCILRQARRGGDLVVVSCARRERPDGLGARDHLIKIIAGVPCTIQIQ